VSHGSTSTVQLHANVAQLTNVQKQASVELVFPFLSRNDLCVKIDKYRGRDTSLPVNAVSAFYRDARTGSL